MSIRLKIIETGAEPGLQAQPERISQIALGDSHKPAKMHTSASGLLQIFRNRGKHSPQGPAPAACRANSHRSVPSFVSGNIASASAAASNVSASWAKARTGCRAGTRGLLAKQLTDKSSWPAFIPQRGAGHRSAPAEMQWLSDDCLLPWKLLTTARLQLVSAPANIAPVLLNQTPVWLQHRDKILTNLSFWEILKRLLYSLKITGDKD